MAGAYGQPYQQQWPQQPQPFGQAYGQQWPTQPWQQPYGQQTPVGMPQQQTGWQQSQPYGLPWQQQALVGMPAQQQPWQQAAPMGQPAAQQPYAPMAGMPTAAPQLNERSQAILGFLSAHELCGPTDLANALGGSNATWSRALQDLAGQGVVIKDSQKYRLTSYGQSLIG